MRNVLVLGAYGLIGSGVVAALKKRGALITGMGRSSAHATRSHSDIDWVITDVTRLSVQEWRGHLEGIDVVVNAAGALQDGAKDNLNDIHDAFVARLCAAAQGTSLRLVQISAAGVSPGASTEFFRSKARGDAHVQTADFDWIILRPTLVIGPNAYGGTAPLRGVAGFPLIGAQVYDDRPVKTISVDELSDAVADCALSDVQTGRIYDLTETDSRGFGETVALIRNWLGFAPFKIRLPIPDAALMLTGRLADGLGWLGWRSPLRSTALKTIAGGVTGDPTAWREAGGREFSSLPETLSSMPATLQERWFARLFLMLPLSVATLSAFWIASGLIGFWQLGNAMTILTDRGFHEDLARAFVIGGAFMDIFLGALILYRPWAKHACFGMIALAIAYLAAATLFASDLWADPLGPLVKVLPSIGLALVTYAMLEER